MTDQRQTDRPELRVKRIRAGASIPFYAHPGDSGMDVTAAEKVTLLPGEIQAIPTGLILAIPEGYELQIRPRSGLSLKTRLRLPNSPGTIDSGYRDELKILVENTSQVALVTASTDVYDVAVIDAPHGTYQILPGDRIAQMVLAPVTPAQIREATLTFETEDRGGGFGSSGHRHPSEVSE